METVPPIEGRPTSTIESLDVYAQKQRNRPASTYVPQASNDSCIGAIRCSCGPTFPVYRAGATPCYPPAVRQKTRERREKISQIRGGKRCVGVKGDRALNYARPFVAILQHFRSGLRRCDGSLTRPSAFRKWKPHRSAERGRVRERYFRPCMHEVTSREGRKPGTGRGKTKYVCQSFRGRFCGSRALDDLFAYRLLARPAPPESSFFPSPLR